MYKIKWSTILLCLCTFKNAMGIQVVDIAGRYAAIGSRGPALVNFEPHYTLPYGYADIFIGPPAGTNSIGLKQGIFRANGFIPHRNNYDGQYVAVNRGAVHIAPLIGHLQSVKTTNLEPAPATTW
ncbi:uncharacterized protein LOC129570236 [Sitodiplosis mosellana]|uniref:uncharacterized protein LOC129570236 n=1 Tax=Sitodiplosis mosellana TaxID=263140 RepID=UPI0024437E81|nr:uncharacterized protein LOC129570236 [Sitodiplosis mosellana]